MAKIKSFLRKQLDRYVYNPDLPEEWGELPYHQQMYLFHGLFLLLNPEFQKQFGKYIEFLLSQRISWKSPFLSTEDFEQIEHYKKPIRFDDLCSILLRNKYLFTSLMRGFVEKDDSMTTFVSDGYIPKSYEDFIESQETYIERRKKLNLPSLDAITDKDYREYMKEHKKEIKKTYKHKIKKYDEYIKSLQKGIIPPVIYPEVQIMKDKKKLISDFKKFVDKAQRLYFRQNPEAQHFYHGHDKRKNEDLKRVQKYDTDLMKKRYQAYIYYSPFFDKSYQDIANEFYPGDAGNYDKTKKHIEEARKLVKNAWSGDFPGNF